MTDREKVINALERCESYGYCEDTGCPYYENVHCLELLRKDALTLLKEQEPVLLENQHKPGGHFINANSPWISKCPKCGKKVEGRQTRFCKYCGKAVKWE